MDSLVIDPLEKFQSNHLPTRNEVLGRFLYVKAHCPNLSDSEIVDFVSQQVIHIWKGHKIPCLQLQNASNKLFHIVKRWKKVESHKNVYYLKVRNQRQNLYDFLGEVFDIFSGGLTDISDLQIREFYVDSCHPQRKRNDFCERQPSLEIDQQAFRQLPLEENNEQNDDEMVDEPTSSRHGMRTRNRKESDTVFESPQTSSKKRAKTTSRPS